MRIHNTAINPALLWISNVHTVSIFSRFAELVFRISINLILIRIQVFFKCVMGPGPSYFSKCESVFLNVHDYRTVFTVWWVPVCLPKESWVFLYRYLVWAEIGIHSDFDVFQSITCLSYRIVHFAYHTTPIKYRSYYVFYIRNEELGKEDFTLVYHLFRDLRKDFFWRPFFRYRYRS